MLVAPNVWIVNSLQRAELLAEGSLDTNARSKNLLSQNKLAPAVNRQPGLLRSTARAARPSRKQETGNIQ
eukprot:9498538-Pyramimonas_sp.AAC.1